jgi:hypothetical protein
LFEYIPNLKYIHVLRNGLDMAFSENKNQLKNWGWKFGIESIEKMDDITASVKQLDYWIKSTEYILEKAKTNKNIYILNYDKFCINPKFEIMALFDFLEINIQPDGYEKISKIPILKNSIGRHKLHETNLFSEQQINFVKQCGFITYY